MKLGSVDVNFLHLDKKFTVCTVTNGESAFQGVATCSEDDKFSRSAGRKISLTKALSKSDLTKEIKTGVWNSYRDMPKKPRW